MRSRMSLRCPSSAVIWLTVISAPVSVNSGRRAWWATILTSKIFQTTQAVKILQCEQWGIEPRNWSRTLFFRSGAGPKKTCHPVKPQQLLWKISLFFYTPISTYRQASTECLHRNKACKNQSDAYLHHSHTRFWQQTAVIRKRHQLDGANLHHLVFRSKRESLYFIFIITN